MRKKEVVFIFFALFLIFSSFSVSAIWPFDTSWWPFDFGKKEYVLFGPPICVECNLNTRGDADNNCKIEESDAVFIDSVLAGKNSFCNGDVYSVSADVNNDGVVDESDSKYLRLWLFKKGLPPADLAICFDNDKDGYGNGCDYGLDCDDNNPLINSGAEEVCNDNLDNNCNSEVDENCQIVEKEKETEEDSIDESPDLTEEKEGTDETPAEESEEDVQEEDVEEATEEDEEGGIANEQSTGEASESVDESQEEDNEEENFFEEEAEDVEEIVRTYCGDGIIQNLNDDGLEEECDDRNSLNGDGCSSTCVVEGSSEIFREPICGNGIRESNELCDDGIENGRSNKCSSRCNGFTEPICGNNAREPGEECDDGNSRDRDGCSSDCDFEGEEVSCEIGDISFFNTIIPFFGNNDFERGLDAYCGRVASNEQTIRQIFIARRIFGLSTVREFCGEACGNGIKEGLEQCDDGNLRELDGCTALCSRDVFCSEQSNFQCRNGILEPGEECDDGNSRNRDGCTTSCLLERNLANCVFTGASWSVGEAMQGARVELSITGTNCNGLDLGFEIFEEDFSSIDDSVQINPTNSRFSNGRAISSWIVEYQTDEFFSDPEYYFIAHLANDRDFSIKSNQLIVRRIDTDRDGIPDLFDNCPNVRNTNQENRDRDDLGDACDYDSDNDGILDNRDNCIQISNSGQEDFDSDNLGNVCDVCPNDNLNDRDGDGVCADDDNCPFIPNALQEDSDSDGVGDFCDGVDNLDLDSDGVLDGIDNCPGVSNTLQEDSDNDGLGNVCDVCSNDNLNDRDGDGVCADDDNCPFIPNALQEDSDSDGVGDFCDSQLCGNGIIEENEICDDGDRENSDGCSSSCLVEDGWTCDEFECALLSGLSCDDCGLFGLFCDRQTCEEELGNGICYYIENDGLNECGFCNEIARCEDYSVSSCESDICGIEGCVIVNDACVKDTDIDGILDSNDNCLEISNARQEDSDSDGIGDLCDVCPNDANNDIDSDGICEPADNCPSNYNPTQIDNDRDGLGYACDSNDRVSNTNAPQNPRQPTQPPNTRTPPRTNANPPTNRPSGDNTIAENVGDEKKVIEPIICNPVDSDFADFVLSNIASNGAGQKWYCGEEDTNSDGVVDERDRIVDVAGNIYNNEQRFKLIRDLGEVSRICGTNCRDGVLEPGEECDDGNDIDNDACSSLCSLKTTCGSGYTVGSYTLSSDSEEKIIDADVDGNEDRSRGAGFSPSKSSDEKICELVSLKWKFNEADYEDSVELELESKGCNGEKVEFAIAERDLIGGDDEVVMNIKERVINDDLIVEKWIVEKPSGFIEDVWRKPEYFVSVKVGDRELESDLLIVRFK